MTQIISLISHISFSCIEKVIDPTVGRQKVKPVEMCLLPDFVVWWSHAEKAAPPQPSRSYWEPSHTETETSSLQPQDSSGQCIQEEDWKIVC